MAAVASNRTTVSSTVLLTLIFTGWCLASAAIPVANARRLQQVQIATNNAAGELPFAASLAYLIDGLEGLLQALLKNAQRNLQEVAANVAQARSQLQTVAAGLQGLPNQVRTQIQGLHDLQNLLNQVLSQLQSVVGGRLQNLPANLQAQLQALTVDLHSSGSAKRTAKRARWAVALRICRAMGRMVLVWLPAFRYRRVVHSTNPDAP
ncbi:unnamed protein product [Urochloa humidicola]